MSFGWKRARDGVSNFSLYFSTLHFSSSSPFEGKLIMLLCFNLTALNLSHSELKDYFLTVLCLVIIFVFNLIELCFVFLFMCLSGRKVKDDTIDDGGGWERRDGKKRKLCV